MYIGGTSLQGLIKADRLGVSLWLPFTPMVQYGIATVYYIGSHPHGPGIFLDQPLCMHALHTIVTEACMTQAMQ